MNVQSKFSDFIFTSLQLVFPWFPPSLIFIKTVMMIYSPNGRRGEKDATSAPKNTCFTFVCRVHPSRGVFFSNNMARLISVTLLCLFAAFAVQNGAC